MIVNGKLVQYDLSRFEHCSIKKPAICDLMQLPEFVAMLENENEFMISDEWMIKTILQIKASGTLNKAGRNLLRHAYRAYVKAGYINESEV